MVGGAPDRAAAPAAEGPTSSDAGRPLTLRGLWGAATRLGAAVAVVAVVLGITPMFATSRHTLGPGTVDIGFRPAWQGSTVLALPPIGEASADTHRGPVQVRLELRSLDVTALIGDDGRVDRDALEASIGDDVRGAVVGAAVRFALLAAVVGAVAAAILARRRWKPVLAGALGGLALGAALVASALPGFDVSAFDDLTYQGPVTEGTKLLKTLTSDGGAVGQRVGALSSKLAGLYSATLTDDLAADDEVVVLHVSDLHLNPIGAQLARRLAESFDVDAVVDTGDTTSFGTRFEGPYAELLADFPVPYLFVAGNHDSIPNRAAIKATPGVTALHDTAVDVEGVVIAGYDDPVITTVDDPPRAERERREEAAAPDVRALIERTRPDVLAVHNPVILKTLVGGDLSLAIAGHQHEYRFGARKGTLIALAGSTGATGLGSLLVDADIPASANLLHFRQGRLTAIDRLEVIGTAGDLLVQRHTVTDEDRRGNTAPFIGRDVDEGVGPKGTQGEDGEDGDNGDGGDSDDATTTTSP